MVEEGTENGQTGQDVGEDIQEVAGADSADSQPEPAKDKSKRSRRTVRTVMREAIPHAPANLLEVIENWLGVNSLQDLRDLEGTNVDHRINSAFNRYTNRVITDPEILTKGMAEGLREYASERNIDYGSMFGRRGAGALNDAIRSVSGYNDIQSIIDAAS